MAVSFDYETCFRNFELYIGRYFEVMNAKAAILLFTAVDLVKGLLMPSRISSVSSGRRSQIVINHYASSDDIVSSELLVSTVPKQFEPQVSVETASGMLIVTALCVIAASYWWNVVIPDRRTELAISKRKGEVKEYLDELRESEESSNRKAERWLFADWLKAREAKPGALPFLKKAKWNSGDNPILVAFAGIISFVIAASLVERVVQ